MKSNCIDLTEFQYSKDNPVKSCEKYIDSIAKALNRLNLSPQHSYTLQDLQNEDISKIIYIGTAVDGALLSKLDQENSCPAIHTYTKQKIQDTPFLETPEQDRAHQRQCSFSDSLKDNAILTWQRNLTQKMNVSLRQPKLFNWNEGLHSQHLARDLDFFPTFGPLSEPAPKLLKYLLLNDTRWAAHWGPVLQRRLENYCDTRRMNDVIVQNCSAKVIRSSSDWRSFSKSNDFAIFIVIMRDYMKQVSDPCNLINQKATFRFAGDLQYYYKSEIENTLKAISNLENICNFIDQCNLYQWLSNYDEIVENFIDANKELFEYNDMLEATLQDILKYQFFGFRTTFYDSDNVSDEFKQSDLWKPPRNNQSQSNDQSQVSSQSQTLEDVADVEEFEPMHNDGESELINMFRNNLESRGQSHQATQPQYEPSNENPQPVRSNRNDPITTSHVSIQIKEKNNANVDGITSKTIQLSGLSTSTSSENESKNNLDSYQSDSDEEPLGLQMSHAMQMREKRKTFSKLKGPFTTISLDLDENKDFFYDNDNDNKDDHTLDQCDDNCQSILVLCSVCGDEDSDSWNGWFCLDHLCKKIKKIFDLRGFKIEGNLKQFIRQRNVAHQRQGISWICPDCMDNITKLNIKHYIDFFKSFLNVQYGNEGGRLKLKNIESDSDYNWRCVSVQALIKFFESIEHDIESLVKFASNAEFMTEGKDDFYKLIDMFRDRCNSKDDYNQYSTLIPASNDVIWKDIMKLKHFIVDFFVKNRQLLRTDRDKFIETLWQSMMKYIKSELKNIEFLYALELLKARFESIMENMCSILKRIYNVSWLKSSLRKALTANLFVNKSFEQRNIIVSGIAYLYQLIFDYGCEYRTTSKQYKSRTSEGTTMDRLSKKRKFSALDLDCKQKYQCKVQEWYLLSEKIRR